MMLAKNCGNHHLQLPPDFDESHKRLIAQHIETNEHFITSIQNGDFNPRKALISTFHTTDDLDAIPMDLSPELALRTPQPTLGDICKYHGRETAMNVLKVLLGIINDAMGSKGLTNNQLELFAQSIYSEYHFYKTSEIKTVLMHGVLGKLTNEKGEPIKFFGTPDMPTLMEWFRVCDLQRTDAAKVLRESGEFRKQMAQLDSGRKLISGPKKNIPENEKPLDGETGWEYVARMMEAKKTLKQKASIDTNNIKFQSIDDALKSTMHFTSIEQFFNSFGDHGATIVDQLRAQWFNQANNFERKGDIESDQLFFYVRMCENFALVQINDNRDSFHGMNENDVINVFINIGKKDRK